MAHVKLLTLKVTKLMCEVRLIRTVTSNRLGTFQTEWHDDCKTGEGREDNSHL